MRFPKIKPSALWLLWMAWALACYAIEQVSVGNVYFNGTLMDQGVREMSPWKLLLYVLLGFANGYAIMKYKQNKILQTRVDYLQRFNDKQMVENINIWSKANELYTSAKKAEHMWNVQATKDAADIAQLKLQVQEMHMRHDQQAAHITITEKQLAAANTEILRLKESI